MRAIRTVAIATLVVAGCSGAVPGPDAGSPADAGIECDAPDLDGDGHASPACGGDDCDTVRSDRYPGADERCDGVDHDCDGRVDEAGTPTFYPDADGDGYGVPVGAMASTTCDVPAGWADRSDDCDDADASVFPGIGDCVAPRVVAPANGATTGSVHATAVGTLRPIFRWDSVGDGGFTYDLEVDDSCVTPGFARCAFDSPELSLRRLDALSAQPAEDLPVNTAAPVGRRYYWRVRACGADGCGPWSRVRFVDVGRVRGDLDGDGYSDVVVAASRGGDDGVGRVFVFRGSASGVSAVPSETLAPPGDAASGQFGSSLGLGDVNADGFADLLVGASSAPPRGQAYLYLGGAQGLSDEPSVRLVHPDPASSGGSFGGSIAADGDLNADGYADVVVGAPRHWAPERMEGAAFVYLGGAGGISTAPGRFLDNPADQELGRFGESVSSAGDLDGDGFADLVVGAGGVDGGAPFEGHAFVFLGSESGVPATPSRSLDSPTNQESAHFGRCVASAGDLDGDGYADLVVGAPGQSAGAREEGNAFVYPGGPDGVGPSPGVTLDNPINRSGGHFGECLAVVGDVDRDGYSDVVVGAFQQELGARAEGNAFLYLGGAGAARTAPDVSLDSPGNQPHAWFGRSVAAAGDVNGDGHDDVVIGAPNEDEVGRAYVFLGGDGGLPAQPSVTLEHPTRQDSAMFGASVAHLAEPLRGSTTQTRHVWSAT